MTDPMRKAMAFARQVVGAPDAFPTEFVALRRSTIARLLSGERVRLLDLLDEHGPYDALNDLARDLERRPSAVARDVKALEDAGLVARARHGRHAAISATGRAVLVY